MKARYEKESERKPCPICKHNGWNIIIERGGDKPNIHVCSECGNLIQFGENSQRGEREYKHSYSVLQTEFEKYVGREPKDRAEFESWAARVFKGIDAQIDWTIAMECASDGL